MTTLAFDCLVQTGTITDKIFNMSGGVAIINMTNIVPGQMLHGQMLYGQIY